MILGASGALWGFGQGNLFARLDSSESMIPGSESDIVLQASGTHGVGEKIIVVVNNGTVPTTHSQLADFRKNVRNLSHVTSVADPETVHAQFEAEKTERINQAVQQALAQYGNAVDPATAHAITQQVRQSAEEKLRAQPDPADMFTAKNSYVIAISLEPGHWPDTVTQIDRYVTEFNTGLKNSSAHALSTTLAKNAIMEQTAQDLVIGEAVGLPLALVLLIVIFGGFLAAGMPLIGALTSIAAGLGVIWVLTFVTTVDNFIINIVSLIGLALSIDYGLLIVSRFREETQHTSDPSQAIQRTISTAGRTVAFSALTIAFSICGLFFMNAPILRMIAAGGVSITLLAVLTALTLVPALIALNARRLQAPSPLARIGLIRILFKKVGDSSSEHGIFSRLARWIHRKPWPVLLSSATIIALLILPLSGLSMRSNFMEYLPQNSPERSAYTNIQSTFPAFSIPSGTVLANAPVGSTKELQRQIAELPHVANVREPIDIGNNRTLIDFVVDTPDQAGPPVTQTVQKIRALQPGYTHFVGGSGALQLDFNESIRQDAPAALAVVAIAVLMLLFFMTRSVIAPLTALLINSASLLAGLGGATIIFKHGLFGLPQTPGLETFVVATAVAFGFGLAMDYEVFLLARIKEYWDAGESNDDAVVHGLQRSGRIITSAAAIIVAVFIGFVFGDLVAVKQIGVVLALIVIIDATVVRMLLVPAMMTLLGRWNWWAPAPLKRLYNRFRIMH